MALAFGTQRPLITQEFITFAVAVSGVTPTPITQNIPKDRLISSFMISNPLAGSSVYLGNVNVTLPGGANPGVEIQAGQAVPFRENQENRQLYELQALLAQMAKALKCGNVGLEKIPFVLFDLTQFYLISANAAGSTVTVIAFPQMYL